ncbi:MAG: S8 family serine peptidase [Bacteroidota bacterium]
MLVVAVLAILLFPKLSGAQGRFAVQFTAKSSSPFSISSPLDFLSQRALDRRIGQGIAIDQYDIPVNPSYINGLISAGANVRSISRWLNAAVIDVPGAAELAAIQALPYVNSIQPVGALVPGTMPDKFTPESLVKHGATQTQRSTTPIPYGFSADQIQQIGLHMLHNGGFTGAGVRIAVIDAGFLDLPLMRCLDSTRLQGRILSTYDFVDGETDVYDDHYHGAAVLSCIASNIPDTLIGTAPHADYILLRSEDAGSETIAEEFYWAAAAEYADSAGADILSTSLGYTTFDDSTQNHTYADMDGNTTPITIASDVAASRGLIVVNSAGNEGNSPWNYISAPADADSILSIGAVDITGNYASFSGNGPTNDGRVKPDISACGAATWLVSPFSNNQPVQGNGTSFSAPLIAGAMACLRQAYPSLHSQQLIAAIKASASQSNNPDTLLGYGIPNFAFASMLLSAPEVTSLTSTEILVFPNPAFTTESVQLKFTTGPNTVAATQINIFDALGRIIFSTSALPKNGDFTFSVLIPANTVKTEGMYFLQIESGKEKKQARLLYR